MERKILLAKNGIVTEENNSVSIASIAMHHIKESIANTVKKANVIDDIVWISNGKRNTQKIEENLILAFKKYNFNLTFIKANVSNVGEGIGCFLYY